MSAPTMPQVIANAAGAASERFAQREVDRAVSLNGRPTRPLTEAERAWAAEILRCQGCVPSEIAMRLEATRGEYDFWWCSRCEKNVSDPAHAQTCPGVTR